LADEVFPRKKNNVDIRLPPDIPRVRDEVIEEVTVTSIEYERIERDILVEDVEVRPVVKEEIPVPKKVIPEKIDLIEDEKLIKEKIRPEPTKVPVIKPEIVEDKGRPGDRDCIKVATKKVL